MTSSTSLTSSTVYPRVCGGTAIPLVLVVSVLGLSPRVRGNRSNRRNQDVASGSIPACAGEPTSYGAGDVGTSVYPRVCGGTLSAP